MLITSILYGYTVSRRRILRDNSGAMDCTGGKFYSASYLRFATYPL